MPDIAEVHLGTDSTSDPNDGQPWNAGAQNEVRNRAGTQTLPELAAHRVRIRTKIGAIGDSLCATVELFMGEFIWLLPHAAAGFSVL